MNMHVPLGRPQPWVLPITLISLVLGCLAAFMLSTTTDANSNSIPLRPDQQAVFYQRENEKLKEEIEHLRAERDKRVDNEVQGKAQQELLQKEINDLRIRAGSTPVVGPGIVITIDDTHTLKTNAADVNANALITHDVDLMMLVNELRSSGAEAIAINDQRIGVSTAIRCVGPVIQVNERPVSPPFVLKAIGKADTLYGAVNLPYGVLDQLKPLGIHVDVVKRDKLRVPALTVLTTLEVGKPAANASPDDGGGH